MAISPMKVIRIQLWKATPQTKKNNNNNQLTNLNSENDRKILNWKIMDSFYRNSVGFVFWKDLQKSN